MRGRGTRVHILYAPCTSFRSRGVEVNLQVSYRLKREAYLHIFRAVGGSGCSHRVVHQQPAIVACLADIVVVYHSKGKVEPGSEQAHTTRLPESVAYCGRFTRSDGELQRNSCIQWIGYPDAVFVELPVLQFENFPVGGSGCYDETAGFLAMVHDDGCIGLKRKLLLIAALIARQSLFLLVVGLLFLWMALLLRQWVFGALTGLRRRTLAESFVRFPQERDVIVETLHVERAVEVECSIGCHDVSQRCAVFQVCTSHPSVGGIVVGICVDPVEYR